MPKRTSTVTPLICIQGLNQEPRQGKDACELKECCTRLLFYADIFRRSQLPDEEPYSITRSRRPFRCLGKFIVNRRLSGVQLFSDMSPWVPFIILATSILHRSNLVYIYKQVNAEAHALKNPCSHAQMSMVEVPYVSFVVTPSTSLKENSRLNLASSEDRVPISGAS